MSDLTHEDLLTMIATQSDENKRLRLENLELRVRLSKATRDVHEGEVVEPDTTGSHA